MELQEAVRRIHLGRSIAFMGAGFSRGATNVQDDEISSVDDLIQLFASKTGEPDDLPLDLLAQAYEDSGEAPPIKDLLKNTFSAKEAAGFHVEISRLPWRRIYTTNYDNVIEHARRQEGLPTASATAREHPRDFAGYFSVVHLHGFIERITQSDWEEAYVLTDRQYASDVLTGSGWLETFKSDVSHADAIFFFGYSISDIDISRLLYQNPSIVDKTFIVVGSSPRRSTELRASSYGKVIKLDVAEVAAMFPASDDPSAAKPAPFLSTLSEFGFQPAVSPASRQEVTEFLIKGNLDAPLMLRDLVARESVYCFSRTDIGSLEDNISQEPQRLLVHSRLGGGKTSALVELAHYLKTAGFTVLFSNGEREGFENDIDYLSSLDSSAQRKTAVIFENSFYFSNQIKELIERYPLISVIASIRTAALQTRVGDVAEAFGDEFSLIDLNGLSNSEVIELDSILYENGLWGSLQGEESDARQQHILRKCRGDLATVLIDVCRSSDIFSRLKAELQVLDDRPESVRRAIIAALCLTCSGINLSVAQISDVVETDLFKFGATQRDPSILEFFDFERNRVVTRSAAFAEAVLSDIVSDSSIISIVPQLIARLDRLRDVASVYKDAVKQLMRFRFIERILTSEQKEQKLVAFYEAIRVTGVGSGDPQFWLQYAMAAMSFKDFKTAEEHFDAAFGLARSRRGYDPYQIENQYAKFLLESRTQTKSWNDYFDALSDAHSIIARQMGNFREGYYPFRVASLYLDFVEVRNTELSRDQLLRISDFCDQLLALSGKAGPEIRRTGYWRTAVKSLKAAKDFIQETV